MADETEQQEEERKGSDEDQEEQQDSDGQEQQDSGDDGEDKSAGEKAQESMEAHEKAEEKIKELEDDPPEKLEDWPDDEAKYVTFGGQEGEHSYEEGPESNLGPSSLERHADGSITIEGEEVDNPDEHKAEPIPGGPTDTDSRTLSGEKKRAEKQQDYDDESGDRAKEALEAKEDTDSDGSDDSDDSDDDDSDDSKSGDDDS